MEFDEVRATVAAAVDKSTNRKNLFVGLVRDLGIVHMAEIGVWKGDFARFVLRQAEQIEKYVLIDPWRNLPDWNKPFNKSDIEFEEVRKEALSKVEDFKDKVIEIRATTKEAKGRIEDGSLDLVYIDGDHTLRGITIDLVSLLPKVRPGGFLCGDDFCKTIWQHTTDYSPTEVFPFAIHFAEAHDLPIFTLPHDQFLIFKEPRGFEVIDHGGYAKLSAADIYSPPRWAFARSLARRLPPGVKRAIKRVVKA